MFPKKLQLPLRSYKDFFDEAQKIKSGPFSVFIRRADVTRLVVLVPKRTAPLSTSRHRMKRAVYGSLVGCVGKLNKLQCHIVVVVQQPLDFARLSTAINKLLQDIERAVVSVQ